MSPFARSAGTSATVPWKPGPVRRSGLRNEWRRRKGPDRCCARHPAVIDAVFSTPGDEAQAMVPVPAAAAVTVLAAACPVTERVACRRLLAGV